jgi:hypothetical protein
LTLDLESYTEFSVELNFFDGLKNIRPYDRKRLVNFSEENSRKGLKENPYTPARAIERGGLYVGREQELDKIKKTLFGQTHENIGNLVGWVY